jgi:hypothetical protein
MAIIGLTDTSSVTAAYPVIGKLRKGAPKTGNAPGRDIDHFRFTSDNPDVLAAFEAAYPTPEAKRQINCLVVGATPDVALDSWYEHWDASKMTRRCNGQTIEVECGKDGRYLSHQGLSAELRPRCKGCPRMASSKDTCKPVGRLSVIVEELLRAGYVGRVTVETHSLHDLRQLSANLYKAYQDFGDLERLPFLLRRVEAEVSTPRPDGGRSKVRKWLLQLQPSAKWVSVQHQLARRRHYQQLTGQTIDVMALEGDDDFDCEFPELPALPIASSDRPPSAQSEIYSLYEALGMQPQSFAEALASDLELAGRSELVSADVPLLVGVRLGTIAALALPEKFDEDFAKGFAKAKDESGRWLKSDAYLVEAFKSRDFGTIGRAFLKQLKTWDDLLQEIEVEANPVAKGSAATAETADPDF